MDIITSVTAVFTAIGEWFVEFIPTLLGMFYSAETGLTILGVLAIMALAVSIVLLVVNIITNFFQFRG